MNQLLSLGNLSHPLSHSWLVRTLFTFTQYMITQVNGPLCKDFELASQLSGIESTYNVLTPPLYYFKNLYFPFCQIYSTSLDVNVNTFSLSNVMQCHVLAINPGLQRTVNTDLHNNVGDYQLTKESRMSSRLLQNRTQLASEFAGLMQFIYSSRQFFDSLFLSFLPLYAILVLAFISHLVRAITFSNFQKPIQQCVNTVFSHPHQSI